MNKAPGPLLDLDSIDPLTAEVFQTMQRAKQLHRQVMSKKLAQAGGHPGEVFLLRVLAEDDGMSQRDLADSLHLSRPWVTKMLQSLEKTGVVERRPDDQDQRITRVYLTEAGRTREAATRVVWVEYLDQTIGTFSEEDRRQMVRILSEVVERISEVLAATETPAEPAAPEVAGETAE